MTHIFANLQTRDFYLNNKKKTHVDDDDEHNVLVYVGMFIVYIYKANI